MLSLVSSVLALGLVGSTSAATLEKRLTVSTNTCVRVAEKVSVHQYAGFFPLGEQVDVDLNVGECICVAAQAGYTFPLGLSAGVEVITSGHGTITGDAAGSIAAHVIGGSLPIFGSNLFNFAEVDICTVDFIDFSTTQYSFPSTGSCCSTKCKDGYEYYGSKCVPKCTKGQTRCSDGVCKTSCPTSGYHSRRDASTCPPSLTSCPLPKTGSGRQAFECIDITSDLESCGGCQPFSGTDCTALPHTSVVACLGGQCAIQSCQRGFELANNGTSCERISNANLLNSYTRQRTGLKIQA